MLKITLEIGCSACKLWKTMKNLSLGNTAHEDVQLVDDRWGNRRPEKSVMDQQNPRKVLHGDGEAVL
jgi:hypothetical protein